MQHGKVINHALSKFKVHQKNYLIHDLELVAVVSSLKISGHYVYGVYVGVFTDHNSFQYVLKQKDLNLHLRSVLEFVKYYDMSVFYHSSKENVVVDAFSRWVDSHWWWLKKELVCDVYRLAWLGVCLIYSEDGSIIVQNGL